MAEVTLKIGDRDYRIGCADGQEAHLEWLGRLVSGRWEAARRASGGLSTERTLLFVALMLADALNDAEKGGGSTPTDNPLLDRIASRLEALAAALEDDGRSA